MKINEIIYDVFEILNQLDDDRDLDESWLFSKINAYRAIAIQTDYKITREINPTWLQRIRKFQFKKVNADDDPAITISSIQVGRYSLLPVIALPDDQGLYRLSGSGSIRSLDPIDFNTLMMKAELNDVESGYGYYSRILREIYCWPYILEGSAIVIAENPFYIPQLNADGTAVATPSIEDEYPLDIANAQKVILEILTKELQIKIQSISDITNDAQSQLKILSPNAIPQNRQS